MKTAAEMVDVIRKEYRNALRIWKEASEAGAGAYADAKLNEIHTIQHLAEEMGVSLELQSFYFTFGSDEQYPYGRGDYVIVKAYDIRDAAKAYQRIYPNRDGSECLNCADYYSAKDWESIYKKYYNGVAPKEVIY